MLLKWLSLEFSQLQVVLPVEALVASIDASSLRVVMLCRLCAVHWPVAWNRIALSSEHVGLELRRCVHRVSLASSGRPRNGRDQGSQRTGVERNIVSCPSLSSHPCGATKYRIFSGSLRKGALLFGRRPCDFCPSPGYDPVPTRTRKRTAMSEKIVLLDRSCSVRRFTYPCRNPCWPVWTSRAAERLC